VRINDDRLKRAPRAATALLLVAIASVALSACGSSSPPATTTTTSSLVPPGAQGLRVNAEVVAQLLAAAAAVHGLPVSDYVGLAKGRTFYAYDSIDKLFWAGAALVPSPTSFQAQVGVQDDGGYNLFTRPKNGLHWTSYNDGLGTVPGSNCEVVVPAVVREVWGWSLTTPCGGPQGG
jgi:hypothetical protein